MLDGAMKIDQLRIYWRGRELSEVGRSFDNFDMVRPMMFAAKLWKNSIEVRGEDCTHHVLSSSFLPHLCREIFSIARQFLPTILLNAVHPLITSLEKS